MRLYAAVLSTLLLAPGCASAPPTEAPPPKPAPPAEAPKISEERAPAPILHLWTQLVSGGTRYPGMTVGLARAVVSGQDQACPAIQLDDLPGTPMTPRPNPLPGAANYPITVCEHPLVRPDGKPAGRARIGDRLLPVPGTVPARIAVLGDTGCRDDEKQSCDESHWPFERIASTVARQSPTLVVNLGDYRYRQNDAGCASGCVSPTWDNWQGWEDDFFKPAGELLQVAPWVMSRGNHEDCDLTSKNGNGRGWFYLLDPSSALLGASPLPQCGPDPKTPAYTPTYAVDVALGGGATQRLVVLDSADAPDDNPPAAVLQVYQGLLGAVKDLAQQGRGPAWLVTHRPVWGVKSQACGKPPELMNATLQRASGGRLPRVSLVLAGHLHLFQSLNFVAADRPPTAIVGTSGAALVSSPVAGHKEGTLATSVDGGDVSAGFLEGFGFLMLAWDGSGSWQATVSSPDGEETRRCRFQGNVFDCGFLDVDPCAGAR
jgi:calcineurin-like phosphoesterase family protein